MQVSIRIVLVSLFAMLAWVAGAAAAADTGDAARRYAVLSLIGDAVSVVIYQPAIGGNTDRNRRASFPVPGVVFDQTALLAADDALRRHDPQADVILLSASPALHAAAAGLLDDSRATLPAELDAVVKARAATHLVLVRKHRADARLQAARTMLGSGKLEGLGFYIDRETTMTRADTGQEGEGFLGPYAYVKLALVELATGRLVREERVTRSTTFAASRGVTDSDPWSALTDTQKIETLRRLVAQAVGEAVPRLVRAAGTAPAAAN